MSYLNPLDRGAVWVTGCSDDFYDDDEYHEGPDEKTEKGYFFQYRPNLEGDELVRIADKGVEKVRGPDGNQVSITYDEIMNGDSKEAKKAFGNILVGPMGLFIFSGCDACCHGTAGNDPVVITFKNGLAVSPTHYSIRNAGCYGMAGDWDFSGSIDGGKTWMVLHRQRGRTKLHGGISGGSTGNTQQHVDENRKRGEEADMKIRDHLRGFEGIDARKEALCDYFEEHQRHTFKLQYPSADFFTHFRFISVQTYNYDERNNFCLHGIGFEVWGDVREDALLGSQPSALDSAFARIDELELQTSALKLQNSKLESKNASIESRLKALENKLKS